MGEKTSDVHWSFWVVGVVALIWHILGSINFFVQMDPDILANYLESEQAIVEGRSLWATLGFAVAVFGGVIGSFLLFIQKSSALYLFLASLVGVVITMIDSVATIIGAPGVGIPFGFGESFGIILMPLVVAGFLIWYSRLAAGKGWIS